MGGLVYQPLASMLQNTGIADPTPQVTTELKYLPGGVADWKSTTNSAVERNINTISSDKIEDFNRTRNIYNLRDVFLTLIALI